MQLARGVLLMVLALSVAVLLEVTFVSSVQQRAAQHKAFDKLRGELADGTAPLASTDKKGREVRPGTPIAYLEIPSIHLKQVVVEGTSSGNLMTGPGHRRDTALPGQPGVSVLMGRRAAFGGPFSDIASLRKGATIRVTTGQGKFTYKVIDVRRQGDPVPPTLKPGAGRLLLATAGGGRFVPAGIIRVDADLATPTVVGSPPLFATGALPAAEDFMASDRSTLWALAMWLQALVAAVVGATWAWYRWGRSKAWIVFAPPIALVALMAAGEFARLLPNML